MWIEWVVKNILRTTLGATFTTKFIFREGLGILMSLIHWAFVTCQLQAINVSELKPVNLNNSRVRNHRVHAKAITYKLWLFLYIFSKQSQGGHLERECVNYDIWDPEENGEDVGEGGWSSTYDNGYTMFNRRVAKLHFCLFGGVHMNCGTATTTAFSSQKLF